MVIKDKFFHELYANKVVGDFESIYKDFLLYCDALELVTLAAQFNAIEEYISESIHYGDWETEGE